MEDILVSAFLKILNMSITGSYIILAVLLVRFVLRAAPKKYSYALWAAAFFRLICPVSFKSVISIFSLRPFDIKLEDTAISSQTAEIVHISENIGMMAQPEIQTGIAAVDKAVNKSLPEASPMYSANPLQIWEFFGMLLWLVGIAALIVISLVGLWRLCRRLRTATLLEGNVWQSENVQSPFIIGLLKPKIYIPYGLEGAALDYVLAHERAHIKRGDHIIRTLAYLVLCLHWFNPLVWLAFWLAGRDMELSCDEKVLGSMGGKVEYSETLLSFASPRRFPSPTPLAFGESGVSRRIKNALKWKRPRLWISAAALVLCAVVIAACAANPKDESGQTRSSEKIEKDELWGDWVSVDYEDITPLSSMSFANGDNGCLYRISETGGLTVHPHTIPAFVNESYRVNWGWEKFPYSDEEWARMAEAYSHCFPLPISEMYAEILYQPLDARMDDADVFWKEYPQADNFLLSLDGNIKMIYLRKDANGMDIVSDIVSLERIENLGTAIFSYEPDETSGEPGIVMCIPETDDVEYINSMGSIEVYDAEGKRFSEGEITHSDGQSVSGHIPAGGKLFWSPVNKSAAGIDVYDNGHISFDINGFSLGAVYINSMNGTYTLSTAGGYTRLEQNADGSVSLLFIKDDAPSSEELARNSLWKFLTGLDVNGAVYFGISGEMVDFDVGASAIKEGVIDALGNISPEEIKIGRGSPRRYSIDIGYGPSEVITLGYGGGDFVELQLSDELKELYPVERGVWEIHNDALTELMAALEAKPFAEFELNDAEEVKILFDIPGADMVDYSRQTEAFPVGNSVYSSASSGKLFGEAETLIWSPYVERSGGTYPAERGEISVSVWRDNDFVQGWLNFRCSQNGDSLHCKAYANGGVSARLDEATGQIIVTPEGEFRSGMYEYISGLEAKDIKVVGVNPTELNETLPDELNEAVAEAFGNLRASELSIGGGVIFEMELALETPEGSLSLLYDGDKAMLDLAGELEKKYSGIVGCWMVDSPAIRSLFDSILSYAGSKG